MTGNYGRRPAGPSQSLLEKAAKRWRTEAGIADLTREPLCAYPTSQPWTWDSSYDVVFNMDMPAGAARRADAEL